MRKSRNPASLVSPPKREVVVTSELFEAYLACPTKCFLRFTGEVATGNSIATWNHTWSESYRHDGIRRLTADDPQIFGLLAVRGG